MKIYTKYFLFLFFAAMLFLQHCDCKKDNAVALVTTPQLPPITTEGKMTFGCKLNGKVWLPYSSTSAFFPIEGSIDRDHSYMAAIRGYIKIGSLNEGIELFFNPVNLQTQFVLHQKSTNNFGAYSNYLVSPVSYFTDSVRLGSVSILRFDSVHQIISGTFNFNAIHPVTHDSISITDGRFDMQFSY